METWLRNKISSEIKVHAEVMRDNAAARVRRALIYNMIEHLDQKLTIDTVWLPEEDVYTCTASLVALTVEEYSRLLKKLEVQEELLQTYKHLPF